MIGQTGGWGEGGELSFHVAGGRLGAYAAKILSEKGYRVILYEPKPGENTVCGGLVNRKAVKRYKFLKEAEIWRVDGAIISADGEEIVVERKGVALVIDRGIMHKILIEEAVAEGVDLVEKRLMHPKKPLIAADGAVSIFRRLVTDKEPEYILALQTEVPWEPEKYVRVDFGPWAPGFFGWVIPTGDRARIGVGIPLRLSSSAEKYIKMYAKWLGVRIDSFQGRLIPLGPLSRIAKNGIFLVGDAAAMAKATTGGGISLGLEWIDILIENIDNDANSVYRRTIFPKLLAHRFIREYIYLIGPKKIVNNLNIMKNFLEEKGDMDNPFSLMGLPVLRFIFRSAFRAVHILP